MISRKGHVPKGAIAPQGKPAVQKLNGLTAGLPCERSPARDYYSKFQLKVIVLLHQLLERGIMYTLEMSVRDYECDMQGIVNNSVYQNYLEHARHEYIKTLDINWADYAKRGINMIVIRVELDYKLPLTSGDIFNVSVEIKRESRLKFVANQQIIRKSDGKLMVDAKVFTTVLNEKGRPKIPEEIAALFE